MFDVAEAFLLAPLDGHPKEREEFRRNVLYAPLEGSVEAKKAAKKKAVESAAAQFGLDPSQLKAGRGAGRKGRTKRGTSNEDAQPSKRPQSPQGQGQGPGAADIGRFGRRVRRD